MKKTSKKIIITLTSLAICLVLFILSIQRNSSTKPINHYTYPLTVASKEWNTLTVEEMIEKTQLPSETLSNMTTEELVVAFLDYPLLGNIYTFSTSQAALQSMTSQFNGLSELFLRADHQEAVTTVYHTCKDRTPLQRDALLMLLENM